MSKRFIRPAAVAALVLVGVLCARTASAGVAPVGIGLDTLLPGGVNQNGITVGDKHYDNFFVSSTGGQVIDPEEVEVLFAVEGNQHFMAFLFDLAAMNGTVSDLVIGYDLHVLDPSRRIVTVGAMFDGGPFGDGDALSAATLIETVRTLDGSPLRAGSLSDEAQLTLFNNGDGPGADNLEAELAVLPTSGLHFEKDILASSRQGSTGVGISVVENSVTQTGGTVIPLPAAFWAAMPVLGSLVAGKKVRKLLNRN